jgi:hypothetical protein
MSDAAAGGMHLFLARSSLQFLMATALASDRRQRTREPCRMLFLPDMLEPALFLRAAQAWPESPFDRVQHVDARGSSAVVRRELRRAVSVARPASLTVFNDREEAGQAALIAVARDFPQARRLCAEDGSLAYTDFEYRAHGRVTRLRQRLRLGRRWHDVRVLGTNPLVQQFVALHPALLRQALRHRPVAAFPAAALDSPALRSLAVRLCEATGFDPSTVPAGATVLTVSHSSYATRNPDYAQLVRDCAARLGRRPERFFVKYHPRESQPDYLQLCGPGGARQVARSLPAECLYLMLRDRELAVVGGMSTSLLTAGLLMPRVRCVALMHASPTGETWDRRLLDALRITPLADAAGIDQYFDTEDDATDRNDRPHLAEHDAPR